VPHQRVVLVIVITPTAAVHPAHLFTIVAVTVTHCAAVTVPTAGGMTAEFTLPVFHGFFASSVDLFLHFLVFVVLCLHIASNSFAKSRVVNQSLFEKSLRAKNEPYQSSF